MKRPLLALSLLAFSLAAAPQAELDRAVVASSGMEAAFTQNFTPKGFKKPQIERGTVVFGKLPAMRWTYSAPEAKTFIFDGSQSWFYVPADKQVTVTTINDQRKRELPFLLLGDPVARDKYFRVDEQSHGATTVISLLPRDPGSLMRSVTIESAGATHRIQSIDYVDRDGNRTIFEFSGYRPANVTAATFSFAAPQGVQVVRGD